MVCFVDNSALYGLQTQKRGEIYGLQTQKRGEIYGLQTQKATEYRYGASDSFISALPRAEYVSRDALPAATRGTCAFPNHAEISLYQNLKTEWQSQA